jgi:hypothetical protein
MPKPRQPVADREDLVDLLLILGDDDRSLRVGEHSGDLVRDRIGVDGHRDGGDHLRRRHRPIEPRAIRAGDGDCVATVETKAEQPLSDRARLLEDLGPRPGLPNTVILVTESRALAALGGVRPQQLGEGVIRVLSFARRPHAASLPSRALCHRAERKPPPRGDARRFSRPRKTIQQRGTNYNSPTFVEEGASPGARDQRSEAAIGPMRFACTGSS